LALTSSNAATALLLVAQAQYRLFIVAGCRLLAVRNADVDLITNSR
jgi:hypothetical protein